MAGKTSLVHALMKGKSTQIDEDDRTFGVVFYHWKPEPDVDELELMVVDCAGQKKYHMTINFSCLKVITKMSVIYTVVVAFFRHSRTPIIG
jgi:GTPase SAR1 family protein